MQAGPSLSGARVGNYEIGEQIGSGGMGDVYRGFDRHLQRTVAIKALHSDLLSHTGSRQRFVRETQMACRVVHPHVATVFDVVEHEQHLLLVMELLEGRTLGAVFRERQASPREALRYGREIVEALAAIHRAGLVHRDLKPGNVMISGDGHVKVMDFGVARILPDEDETASEPLTRAGAAIGTQLYMSPEQLRGLVADARSDLFSLGVVLYEALAGEHPFRRDTPQKTVAAILDEAPSGESVTSTLSSAGPLREIVLRLLHKKPEERYQSAEELLGDLRALEEGHEPAYLVRRRRWRRLALAALLLAGTTTAVAAAVWLQRPPTWEKPRIAIAVAPFLDRSGEEDDGIVRAAMLADLLSSELQSSHVVRVIGPDVTAPLLTDAGDDPKAVARRLHAGVSADYALVGTLYREGGRWVSVATLYPATDELPTPPALRSTAASIVELSDDVAWGLRRALPEVSLVQALRDDRIDAGDIGTESEEARMLYERGVLALRDDRLPEAVERLSSAVELDPEFGLAWARLADALDALGYGRRAREAADRAVATAPQGESRAARRHSLELRAMRARIFDHTEEGLAVTSELTAMFPDDAGLLFLHAGMLDKAGNIAESLEALDSALSIDPLHAHGHVLRAYALNILGRTDDALRAASRAEELFELLKSPTGMAAVARARGNILEKAEHFDAAESEYRRAVALYGEANQRGRALALIHLAGLETIRGRAGSAEGVLREAATTARDVGHSGLTYRALSTLGANIFAQGRYEQAEPLLREAVDLAHQLEHPLDILYSTTNLTSLLLYAGKTDEAEPLLAELLEQAHQLGRPDVQIFAGRMLGDLHFQRGRLDEAIEAQRSVKGSGQTVEEARTELYLAWLFFVRGALGEGLDAADRAVSGFRQTGAGELGPALAWRSRFLSALGRESESRVDLESAESIASAEAAAMEDLRLQCALARADLELSRGAARKALDVLEQAFANAQRAAPDLVVMNHIRRCEAWLKLGAARRAVDTCRLAVGHGGSAIPLRTMAESVLAEAEKQAGLGEESLVRASAVLPRADAMGLYLPTARSAAMLVGVDAPGSEQARERGRAALQLFLEGVPPQDRDTVAAQPEIRALKRLLDDVDRTLTRATPRARSAS